MLDNLKAVLQYISPFNQQDLEQIVSCFKNRAITKGTLLVREGAVCKEFYFVAKGCIRTHFITPDGDEKSRYIMPDNSIGTALTSFISQAPSFELLDAIEDSTLLFIHHTDFYRLVDELPGWARFYQKILEMAYTFQNKRIESVMTLTAKERYAQVLAEQPALVQRLSNRVLASYLDMRQETLSRLKSQ